MYPFHKEGSTPRIRNAFNCGIDWTKPSWLSPPLRVLSLLSQSKAISLAMASGVRCITGASFARSKSPPSWPRLCPATVPTAQRPHGPLVPAWSRRPSRRRQKSVGSAAPSPLLPFPLSLSLSIDTPPITTLEREEAREGGELVTKSTVSDHAHIEYSGPFIYMTQYSICDHMMFLDPPLPTVDPTWLHSSHNVSRNHIHEHRTLHSDLFPTTLCSGINVFHVRVHIHDHSTAIDLPSFFNHSFASERLVDSFDSFDVIPYPNHIHRVSMKMRTCRHGTLGQCRSRSLCGTLDVLLCVG